MIGDWITDWAKGDDEAKRHEATRALQGYLHSLPRSVRDAIEDDLRAHREAEGISSPKE